MSAEARRADLEYEIFKSLRDKLVHFSRDYLRLADVTSELDVATATAWLALENNYCRPQFLPLDQKGLSLIDSRHPVVEVSLKKRNHESFTSNSVQLGEGQALLLTGPNMAGKSTLMRQVALTVLMAQAGLFVPARLARLQIFDRIFTRIGASDQLARGQSTFMVEMQETAEMLHFATSRSLLILDEVGRGTSTFDGMSLAQGILEHIVHRIGALTIFATHYHELAELGCTVPSIKNAHMSVIEKEGHVRFLHTLLEGPAEKSYGIYVAKIAGLPESILNRSQILLKKLEAQSLVRLQKAQASKDEKAPPQLSFL